MTLRLTPELLEAAYDLLCHTAPFDRWNLPAGEDVDFKVIRTDDKRGDYFWCAKRKQHVIRISSKCIGTLANLVETMAHEMIHLHEKASGFATSAEHSAAFRKLAAQVCKAHRFDPLAF